MTQPITTIREEFVNFARNVHGADAGLLADHAFGVALAAHDAEVAANALREAHADLQAYTDSGGPFGHRPVEDFLLARADRIEREAADHKSTPDLGSSEGSDRA